MRRRIIGALGVLGVCGLVGVGAGASGLFQQTAVLKDLSIQEKEANSSFFDAVWDGNVWLPGGQKVFKAAAPDVKVAIVRSVGTLLKTYTRSPLFRDRYAETWDASRPRPAERAKTMDDINKESDESIKKMEESIKTMPPDMQKQMAEMVKQMKAQQEEMRKNTEMRSTMDSLAKQQEAKNAERHQEALKEYEINHPKDPDAMIAKRLKDFLALSADVNFDAKLVKNGSLMRFENPAYENKPSEWKLCYRAGKEATAAARTFAQDWLKELGAK